MPQPTTPNPVAIDVANSDGLWHTRINSNFDEIKDHLANPLPVKAAATTSLPTASDWYRCMAISSDDHDLYISNGTVWNNVVDQAHDIPYVRVVNRQALNAAAGDIGTSLSQRHTNIEVDDSHAIASINASNEVVLPAGTYRCRIIGFFIGTKLGGLRLFNTAEGLDLQNGAIIASPVEVDHIDSAWSVMEGEFVLTATRSLTLQDIGQIASTDGRGKPSNFGSFEYYTTAEFWKIK